MENWYLAFHLMIAVRCVVNPLVYGYANNSFRREVVKLVSRSVTTAAETPEAAPIIVESDEE